MNYFEPKILLKKPPPSRRAAYSDRTAWLMAEMSKLAYLKFESLTSEFEKLAERLTQSTDLEDIKDILNEHLIPNLSFFKGDREKELQQAIAKAEFELIKTFDRDGTQAFIAKREKDKIAVLSFRGTEATQLADIKADINAIVTNDSGSRIHSGFLQAFDKVKQPIIDELDKLNEYAIYMTGHSLGGALALISTRELETDNTAACYTFGSPRVGSSEFADSIKTPIYRIVNTADIVPRMPPGIAIELFVDLLRLLQGILPFLEYIAKWLDDKVSGYRHHGDMRYLTYCKNADYSDVRLIANITPLARLRRLIKSRVSINKNIKDHAIDKYCKKLAAYAKRKEI